MQPNTAKSHHLYLTGVQYYAAGRFCVLNDLQHISGVLLHHAVERLLKGKLSETHTEDELKAIWHRLDRAWAAFSALFPGSDLLVFYPVIADLDRFEKLRYGDRLGVDWTMTIAWDGDRPLPLQAGMVNDFQFSLDDIDRLVVRIVELCGHEPTVLLLTLRLDAKRFLEASNRAVGQLRPA